MPFDTSIFRQERVQPLQPMNALMQGLQLQGAQQGNALQQAQLQYYQQQKALELQKAQEEAGNRNALMQFRRNMPDPQAAAVATLGGDRRPTPENAARIPQVDPRIAQATMAFKAGMIPYADFQKIAFPDRKVARTQEVDDGKGGKMIVQWDEQGNRMGETAAGYVAPVQVNQGNQVTFARPQAGVSLPMFMSPEQKDASARGWAGINETRNQNALPVFDSATGSWVNRKTQTVTQAIGADGKPLAGKAVAATEDERKAAGWLAQADNAWKNMREVAFDANGNLKDAAKPGFNDALAAIPSMGLTSGAANMMRSPERQKFMQAASSLSEALLRAATGAGVNESEARQKIQELTPVIGESPETTKQKFAAIPMYLQALQSRAGRAATPGYTPPPVPTGAGNQAPALNMDLFNAADAIIGAGNGKR